MITHFSEYVRFKKYYRWFKIWTKIELDGLKTEIKSSGSAVEELKNDVDKKFSTIFQRISSNKSISENALQTGAADEAKKTAKWNEQIIHSILHLTSFVKSIRHSLPAMIKAIWSNYEQFYIH